jgi:hypothetical protein
MFYWLVAHIYESFRGTVDDIRRWRNWVCALYSCVPYVLPRAKAAAPADQLPVPRGPLPAQLPALADAINGQVPMADLIGFIDGTARHTCRPTHHQDLLYNG